MDGEEPEPCDRGCDDKVCTTCQVQPLIGVGAVAVVLRGPGAQRCQCRTGRSSCGEGFGDDLSEGGFIDARSVGGNQLEEEPLD